QLADMPGDGGLLDAELESGAGNTAQSGNHDEELYRGWIHGQPCLCVKEPRAVRSASGGPGTKAAARSLPAERKRIGRLKSTTSISSSFRRSMPARESSRRICMEYDIDGSDCHCSSFTKRPRSASGRAQALGMKPMPTPSRTSEVTPPQVLQVRQLRQKMPCERIHSSS